jgi:hypothetical protein
MSTERRRTLGPHIPGPASELHRPVGPLLAQFEGHALAQAEGVYVSSPPAGALTLFDAPVLFRPSQGQPRPRSRPELDHFGRCGATTEPAPVTPATDRAPRPRRAARFRPAPNPPRSVAASPPSTLPPLARRCPAPGASLPEITPMDQDPTTTRSSCPPPWAPRAAFQLTPWRLVLSEAPTRACAGARC